MEKTKKAAHGICSYVRNNTISHEDYKESLMEYVVFEHMQSRIGHTNHRLETIDKYKKSLCAFNDRHWIDRNGTEIETYGFGHWRLKGNFLFVL